jgi:hypothetical protein
VISSALPSPISRVIVVTFAVSAPTNVPVGARNTVSLTFGAASSVTVVALTTPLWLDAKIVLAGVSEKATSVSTSSESLAPPASVEAVSATLAKKKYSVSGDRPVNSKPLCQLATSVTSSVSAQPYSSTAVTPVVGAESVTDISVFALSVGAPAAPPVYGARITVTVFVEIDVIVPPRTT